MDSSLQTNTLNPASQNNTQNPQVAGASSGYAASTGRVQQGVASTLLESVNGIPLNAGTLPSVSLNSTTSTLTSAATPAPTKHHINVTFLGLAGLLIVVAVVSFWAVGRSVKSTT